MAAPAQFDVIVSDNFLGDILSDCAALAAGARTADICEPGKSPVSCSEMGAAVVAALQRLQ